MKRDFSTVFRKRGLFLFFFFIGAMLALLVLLLYMQTAGYEEYTARVLDQITVGSALRAERGDIYDRNGNLLVTNVTSYRVYLSPVDIRPAERLYGNVCTRIAAGLSSLLSLDYETVLKKTQRFHLLDETVVKSTDRETADRVLAFAQENGFSAMIHVEATTKRQYLYRSLAAQTIGFTGGDNQGLFGLELFYNGYLAGTDGKYVTAKDAAGHDLPSGYVGYIAPKAGWDMTSTLDLYIQTQLELALQNALEDAGAKNRVAGIVMDVDTGEILAMATLPSYDLNEPYTLDQASLALLAGYAPDSEEYKAAKNELLYTMWSNKAITETYEPGSTFKIITTAMGFETEVITPADRFSCSGAFTVGGVVIHCHKRKGHGSLNFAEGLQQSCNPVFMQVGARVGANRFYEFVSAFGYLSKTGIDLPSETNSIFHRLENIHEVELATASFGQRFNVSLIQQLTAVATVANGGHSVTPHLLSHFTDSEGARVLSYAQKEQKTVVSEETCKTIAEILAAGVAGGGGASNAGVLGYQIAAKTGTSEKLNGGRVGSCVAYAPADNPKIAVIIMVDEPSGGVVYGSMVAAPYVSDLLENVLPYLGFVPQYTEAEQAQMQIPVGSYIGLSRAEAAKQIRALGLTPVFTDGGTEDTVLTQTPMAGVCVTRDGGIVVLSTGGTAPTMTAVPSLVGKSAAEANALLVAAGLNLKIEGAKNARLANGATVIATSHAAGTQLERGTAVTLTFLYPDNEENG